MLALAVGVTGPRMIAAALSPGPTAGRADGAAQVAASARQPSATLLVSRGQLAPPRKLVILMVAVVLLTIQVLAINRPAGIPHPIWNPCRGSK